MAKKKQNNDNIYEENRVYQDLKNQLIANDNYSSYTEELLQKYMQFTEIEDRLNADIAFRGVSIFWSNGGGQEGYKKNDSITELARVNGQKLKLLKSLGIKATADTKGDEDYEV